MAMPSSGAITFAQMQTEFGGSNPIGFNEYYAGGSNVPSGTGSIPSSGTISLNTFYGTQAVQTSHTTAYVSGVTTFISNNVNGFNTNSLYGSIGSMTTPAFSIQGLSATVIGIVTSGFKGGNVSISFEISGSHSQNSFSSISFNSTGGQTSLATSSANSFTTAGGSSTWNWPGIVQNPEFICTSGNLTITA